VWAVYNIFSEMATTQYRASTSIPTTSSPCHRGFYYDNSTQKCVCYDGSDIVSCSGNKSTTKRGYWFGIVDGKTTVADCPNTYCNFTCCETTNGYYRLSPVRVVHTDLVLLVVVVKMLHPLIWFCKLYWQYSRADSTSNHIVYHLLYSLGCSGVCGDIPSCWDWLFLCYYIQLQFAGHFTGSEFVYASQGLYNVVSIISNAAKVTPQFLGQLC